MSRTITVVRIVVMLSLTLGYTSCIFAQNPEQRLKQLNLSLPGTSKALSNYSPAIKSGNIIYLSGKGPVDEQGKYITGKLGKEIDQDKGIEAAKLVALAHLSELKALIKDLSKVKKVLKVNGYINSADQFTQHSLILNGYSDLMVAVFGEPGKHARTSIGVASLPLNMALEIEAVVEVYP